jgi:HAE1 family hydrophobic/amphiphilic exporter-1
MPNEDPWARMPGPSVVTFGFDVLDRVEQAVAMVKERLKRSRALLPENVRVAIIQDQSRYILSALHEIENHLVSGSILACLTVLLFMRSWRSTLIASVAIPASIIATFAFMKAFGFTLNNVTMLALVLMVGVVIDDAIVVLENVYRCIEEEGMDPIRASIEGTKEIGLAVLATTISLVYTSLPLSCASCRLYRLRMSQSQHIYQHSLVALQCRS